MTLREYIKGLDEAGLALYAERCRTTVNYLTTHILYATKEPSVRLMKALAAESDGAISLSDVLEHYGLLVPQKEAA